MSGQRRDRLGRFTRPDSAGDDRPDYTEDDRATLSMLLSGGQPGPAAITWSGASATGLPDGVRPVALKVRGEPTEPIRAVTVPAPSKGAARVRRVRRYLEDEVDILTQLGQAGDIGRPLAALPEDHPARTLVAKAVLLLLGPREPWQPPKGWASTGLPWYEPQDGDDGMPARPDPDTGLEPAITRPYVGREGAR
jgi:hypothetical protein